MCENSHDQIGEADPAKRDCHQQSLAADGVDENAARHVGDGAGGILAGQNRSDLGVVETELIPDQRQENIECGRVPMGERVADADDPDFAKRPLRDRIHCYCRCGHFPSSIPRPRRLYSAPARHVSLALLVDPKFGGPELRLRHFESPAPDSNSATKFSAARLLAHARVLPRRVRPGKPRLGVAALRAGNDSAAESSKRAAARAADTGITGMTAGNMAEAISRLGWRKLFSRTPGASQ